MHAICPALMSPLRKMRDSASSIEISRKSLDLIPKSRRAAFSDLVNSYRRLPVCGKAQRLLAMRRMAAFAARTLLNELPRSKLRGIENAL